MEVGGNIDAYLETPADWEQVNKLGAEIFKEGHLEKLDDFLLLLLPIIHVVYYKSIKSLDDRGYAKEDLISDTVVELYRDMSLRWDKYIHIDNYGEYLKVIAKNVMVQLVHCYHNYYKSNEYNPDVILYSHQGEEEFKRAEASILRENFEKSLYADVLRLFTYRPKQKDLLTKIFQVIYIEKQEDLTMFKSRLHVFGVRQRYFNFLQQHVDYVYKLVYNYQIALIKGNDKMKLRIESVLGRFESPTYAILASNYWDSIIPEIFAEFGPEITRKFVKTFSGRDVKVPYYRDFCDDLLGGTVLSISDRSKEKLSQVSDDYDLSYRVLSRIYDKALKSEKKAGIS